MNLPRGRVVNPPRDRVVNPPRGRVIFSNRACCKSSKGACCKSSKGVCCKSSKRACDLACYYTDPQYKDGLDTLVVYKRSLLGWRVYGKISDGVAHSMYVCAVAAPFSVSLLLLIEAAAILSRRTPCLETLKRDSGNPLLLLLSALTYPLYRSLSFAVVASRGHPACQPLTLSSMTYWYIVFLRCCCC